MKTLSIEFSVDEKTFNPCTCSDCQNANPLLDMVGIPKSPELRCLLKVLHILDINEDIMDNVMHGITHDNFYGPYTKKTGQITMNISLNGFTDPKIH